jgi:AAHS family 4-hydroxybenzoate transporter-like MFS transporter
VLSSSASTHRLVEASTYVIGEHGAKSTSRGIGLLFSQRYLMGTLMLWLAYFMGLVIFDALINWRRSQYSRLAKLSDR